MNTDNLTTDAVFNGRVHVMQDRAGYRFSIDAVILACRAGLHPVKTVMDLGTGCGVIPLILAFRNPNLKITGIEIQKDLADIAALNVKKNSMEDRIAIFHEDMKNLNRTVAGGPFDLVVSNPPYRKVRSGRINPNRQRALARHEIKARLSDVIGAANRLLDISGKFSIIYPAERATGLLSRMRSFNIEPKFFQSIHSLQGGEAKLILVEGAKGGRPGLKIGDPLFIYNEDGSYTNEIEMMYGNGEA